MKKNQELMAKFKRNPELELNTTLWFLPFFDNINKSWINTIFRTAEYFSISQGTKNIIVLLGDVKWKLNDMDKELSNAFPNLNFELIILNENGNKNDLPHSDAAFCTHWTSAYNLVKYNNCKAKFYFNPKYEHLFYSEGSIFGLIEQSYRFGFIGIVNSIGVEQAYKKYNNWGKPFYISHR